LLFLRPSYHLSNEIGELLPSWTEFKIKAAAIDSVVPDVKVGYSPHMGAAEKLEVVSVEEYLAAELLSEVKHEYVAGAVHAMAGANLRHNRISGNVFAALFNRLRGTKCRPYGSDFKVRIPLPNQVRFYYPDVSVFCREGPPEAVYQDDATIVVEVLLPSTRRIDEGEKKDAYLRIPTLGVYLIVEPNRALVKVFRRTVEGFKGEAYSGLSTVIPLPAIGIELPLAEIYEDVDLSENSLALVQEEAG
jgi:Uma2 family endonuclease